MRRLSLAVVFVLLAALPAGSASAATHDGIARVADPAGGRYVVLLNVPSGSAGRVAATLVNRHGGSITQIYRSAVTGFSVATTERAARAIAREPVVSLVEEDAVVRLTTTQTAPVWGLDRIDQRSLPLDSRYTYGVDGTAVDAYVIDTGIRVTHTEFGGRAVHGRDTVSGDQDASDCHGHGTHVAGTIGGSTYGVAKNVRLVAVRVLDCGGSGYTSDVIAGVDWVTGHHTSGRPAVANMSLGSSASSSLDTAVRNSIADGITYAVAAGNGDLLGRAQDACGQSPARVTEAITVGATDSSDRKASFSNYGTCLDLFAPGVSVRSAYSSGDTATTTMSGTSMAAPHVAGVAAQHLAADSSLQPSGVALALVSNATVGVVSSPGTGSPNRLLHSVPAAAAPAPTPAPTPTPTPTPAPTPAPTPTPTPTPASSDPDPGTPTLTSGSPHSTINGTSRTWQYMKIEVPAGSSGLRVVLDGQPCALLGCNPDLDLYVRPGAKPTASAYACRPALGSSDESCTISAPTGGWWYVGIYVYSASSQKSYTVTATVS